MSEELHEPMESLLDVAERLARTGQTQTAAAFVARTQTHARAYPT